MSPQLRRHNLVAPGLIYNLLVNPLLKFGLQLLDYAWLNHEQLCCDHGKSEADKSFETG